jgi:hypothetical protein
MGLEDWGKLRARGYGDSKTEPALVSFPTGQNWPGEAPRNTNATTQSRSFASDWALDFQFDQTTDGRTLKFLKMVDEQ